LLDMVYKYFLNTISNIVMPANDLDNWTRDQIERSDEAKSFVLSLLNNADFNISDIEIDIHEQIIDDNTNRLIQNSDLSDKEKQSLLRSDKLKYKTMSFLHKGEDNINIKLPFELESRGTNRYFGLSGVLHQVLINDKIFIVDEIENSLHPDLVIHFINTFLANSKEAQLICTTHDINILSEQENLRKDVIWFTEKHKDGETELFSLADFSHRKELSFINAYKAGKFGAVPNLGAIYLNRT